MWINLSRELPPAGTELLRVGWMDHRDRIQPWQGPCCGDELHRYVHGPLAQRRDETRIVWWRDEPADPPGYGARVHELEAEGLCTSDAQGVADVEFAQLVQS